MDCMAGYIWGPSHVSRVNPRRVLLEVSMLWILKGKVWMDGCIPARRLGIFWMRKGMYTQTTAANFRMTWRLITADTRGWILRCSEEMSGFCSNYTVLGGVNGNERGEGGHSSLSFWLYATLRFKSSHDAQRLELSSPHLKSLGDQFES